MIHRITGLATFVLIAAAGPLAAQDGTPPKPAKIAEIRSTAMPLERRFYGRVQAKETVDLAFQVAGQIVKLPVVEGQPLDEGDLIAELDLKPFRLAVDRAETELRDAERDRIRMEKLRAQDTVPQVDVDDAISREELARIDLRDARDSLEDATLFAPYDALFVRRLAVNYSTVAAGTPVVRLHNMSELRVDIEVPKILFREARHRAAASFYAAFPGRSTTYPLELREFEAEAAAIGQTYTLTLAFTENPGEWLLPGASVQVYGSTEGSDAEAMLVPETALTFDASGGAGVLVFEPDGDNQAQGRVTRRPVEIEATDNGHFKVLEGLEDGTEIVVAGAAQLRDGQMVRRYTRLEN